MKNLVKLWQKYIRDFKKIGKRERIIIAFILLVAFVIGITGSYAYKNIISQRPATNDQRQISPTPLPKTSLVTLVGSDKNPAMGDQIDVKLNLNSGDLGVEAADFVVNFDPDYLKVVNVTKGTFFKNYPINTTGENFVKISGVADFTEKAVVVPKGEGTVATITFETLDATESTKIEIDNIKTIIASGGQNILDVNSLENLTLGINK